MAAWLWVTLAGLALLETASGHGRLIEPPSRATAWRYGFPTPHNYNDHELYCGGFSRQWSKNGGNCGVCGDAWDQKEPRPHEYGGRFGQGLTVRRYKVSSAVTLRIELTASHNGYFEFRMCPNMENTTQECLDQYVLRLHGSTEAGDKATRFYPKDGSKIYEMKYDLPEGLLCEHCVLQWRYIAGNNWGMCADGTGAVGCGHQEEFRACADVAIDLTGETIVPGLPTARPRPPYVPPSRRTTTPTPETAPTSATPHEEEGGSSWVGFLIAVITLCFTIVAFGFAYFYYYRGGHRIKNLLLKQGKTVPAEPPVRPPRHKRPPGAPESLPEGATENLEPGFENIHLNEHRI